MCAFHRRLSTASLYTPQHLPTRILGILIHKRKFAAQLPYYHHLSRSNSIALTIRGEIDTPWGLERETILQSITGEVMPCGKKFAIGTEAKR